jgi:tRNA-specific 2-thiouridylase
VSAEVSPTESGFRLRLHEPAYGVAPGQAAVLYDGDAVVGAGTIVKDPAETLRPVSAFDR